MSDINTASRLALVKQIRDTYNRNIYDMANREKILYGKTTNRLYDMTDEADQMGIYNNEKNTAPSYGGLFKLRFVVAAMLFLLFFTMDSKNMSFLGMDSGKIFEAISCDYVKDIDEWIANGLQAP